MGTVLTVCYQTEEPSPCLLLSAIRQKNRPSVLSGFWLNAGKEQGIFGLTGGRLSRYNSISWNLSLMEMGKLVQIGNDKG